MKKAMILASAAMIGIALLSGGAGAQGTPQTVELVKVERSISLESLILGQGPSDVYDANSCPTTPRKVMLSRIRHVLIVTCSRVL